MRVKVDLQKPVFTPAGSLRFVIGNLDERGIVWIEMAGQDLGPSARPVAPGIGIHVASRVCIMRIPEAKADGKKAAAKEAAA